MLIILAGLPGVGKTTIARELARRIGAVHLRIDSIEQAIRDSGVTVVSIDDAGYRVAYALAADNLQVGRVVIADSVNPIPITREAWRQVGRRAGVGFVEVEVVCSDPGERRRRVEERGAQGPSWHDVITRDYRVWDGPRIIVDTAHRTVDDIITALSSELSVR